VTLAKYLDKFLKKSLSNYSLIFQTLHQISKKLKS